jgi:hypothetical protein
MKSDHERIIIPQIIITLLIEDEETIDAYKDCDPEIVMSDLRCGNLIEKCSILDVVVKE